MYSLKITWTRTYKARLTCQGIKSNIDKCLGWGGGVKLTRLQHLRTRNTRSWSNFICPQSWKKNASLVNMLWFNFILGLNFFFLFLVEYDNEIEKKRKLKEMINLTIKKTLNCKLFSTYITGVWLTSIHCFWSHLKLRYLTKQILKQKIPSPRQS